jgi:hypothetical protein
VTSEKIAGSRLSDLALNDSQSAGEFNYERPCAARREYKGCGKSVNGFRNKGDDELLSAKVSKFSFGCTEKEIKMNRVLKFWLALMLNSLMIALVAAQSKPNILILYTDDWRHDTLGSAGYSIVKTPSIDSLARAGVRFTRAQVSTSICGVSRTTLFTGQ